MDILTFATLDPADEQDDPSLADAARAASAVLLVEDEGDDRARWQRKAIKALKDGKPATVKFESAAIPDDEQARIREALGAAQDVAAVVAAFKAVDAVDALIAAEWDAATRWAREASEG